MSTNCYPNLLNNKAKMLGNLTRYDLAIVGMTYLILSWMKVSGPYSLAINAIVLLLTKVIRTKFQRGFFLFLSGEKVIYSKKINTLMTKEINHD